jgi:DNA-binding Lrp family transcriptional regulator
MIRQAPPSSAPNLIGMVEAKITSVEAAIIAALQKNARITNKELARTAGIAESTCLERVRSLGARGVIRGYHADVDLDALGRPLRALIRVRLQPKTTESVNAFQSSVLAAPETLEISTVTGVDDFIVAVGVPDVARLRSFVLEVITSRPDVADAQTSLVVDHHRKAVVEQLG